MIMARLSGSGGNLCHLCLGQIVPCGRPRGQRLPLLDQQRQVGGERTRSACRAKDRGTGPTVARDIGKLGGRPLDVHIHNDSADLQRAKHRDHLVDAFADMDDHPVTGQDTPGHKPVYDLINFGHETGIVHLSPGIDQRDLLSVLRQAVCQQAIECLTPSFLRAFREGRQARVNPGR